MAKRLKCWRKTRSEKGPYDTPYIVYERKGDRISLWGLTAGKINPKKRATKKNIRVIYEVKNKKYKTRKQAERAVQSYMKKHDVC